MYAHIGRDSVDILSPEEAAEFGYNLDDLYTLILFVRDAPKNPSSLMASGIATALIARSERIAVMVITGGDASIITFEHWDAVVAGFAVLLDRLSFMDAEITIASAIAASGRHIIPANLLLPPDLPF